MTESAEEKRKRRLIDSLENYQWKYQYSIFPDVDYWDKELAEDSTEYTITDGVTKLREKLREKFLDTGMLFELRRSNVKEKTQFKRKRNWQKVYATLHTTKELNDVKLVEVLESVYHPDDYHCSSREVIQEKIDSSIKTIKNQKLHKVVLARDGKEFNRFSIINKKHLIPVSVV